MSNRRGLPVKVRLEGFPDDIAELAEILGRTPGIEVTDYSRRSYANHRGNPGRVRCYLEVITDLTANTAATEVDPTAIEPAPPHSTERPDA